MKRCLAFQIFFLFTYFFSTAQQSLIPDMLENTLKGVVTVAIYQTDNAMKPMGFRGAGSNIAYSKVLDLSGAKGSGSGFIIEYNHHYYIITNAHVVQNATSQNGSIYVYTVSYKKYAVKIVGGDTFYDLAVLEFIDSVPSTGIGALKFKQEEARLGEQVFAIGNPLGDYPFSVSDGIISGKNRIRGGITGKFGFLQTTATIIWGNSGGPLIDINGNVAGINSQIAFAEMDNTSIWQPQINFALEAHIAQRLIHDILSNNGLIKRAYIGVEVTQDVIDPDHPEVKQQIQRENLYNEGPTINGLVPKSPADGLLNQYKNAKILSINNEEVRNVQEVLGAFEKITPGETIVLKLSKNGVANEVKIVTMTSNAQTNAAIAYHGLGNKGCTIKPGDEKILINFENKNINTAHVNQIESGLLNLGQKKEIDPQILLDKNWTIEGAGIFSQQTNQIWLVKDMADLGTILRLCGTTGVFDLILLRIGSDPSRADNYIRKRFVLSGMNFIYQQTLWY